MLCVDDLHWADTPSLRWRVGLARRVDELPLALAVAPAPSRADPRTLGELLGQRHRPRLPPLPPSRPRARPCGAARRRAGAGRGLPRRHRRQPVPAGCAARPPPGRADTAPAAVEGVGPYVVGRWVHQQFRRLPAGTTELARALAVLAPTRPRATPPHSPAWSRSRRRCWPTRCGRPASPRPATSSRWPTRSSRPRSTRGSAPAGAASGTPGPPACWPPTAMTRNGPPYTCCEPAGGRRRRRRPAPRGRRPGHGPGRAGDRGGVPAPCARRAAPRPRRRRRRTAELALAGRRPAARHRRTGPSRRSRIDGRPPGPTRAPAAQALGLAGHNDAAVELCRLVPERRPAYPRRPWPGSRPNWRPTPGPTAARRACPRECPAGPAPNHHCGGWGRPWRRRSAAGRPPNAWRSSHRCSTVGRSTRKATRSLPTVATITLLVNEDLDRALGGRRGRGRGRPRTRLDQRGGARPVPAVARVLPAGAVREAEADARAAYEFKLATVTPLPATLWALHPLVEALIEGDRADEADAALHAAGLGDPPPHALTAPLILQSRARLRLAQGRAADALTDLRDAAARWEELSVRHPGDGRLAGRRGRRPAVAGRAGRGGTAGDRTSRGGPAGRRARAAVRGAAGERPGRAAGGPDQTSGAGGTGIRRASAHVRPLRPRLRPPPRQPTDRQAREPLRAALDLADAGGAARLARLALAELHAAGARPRRAALRGLAALTEAEEQIAALAADGRTNREIAERLALSRRTVETHLAHAYQKLDIRSRGRPGRSPPRVHTALPPGRLIHTPIGPDCRG